MTNRTDNWMDLYKKNYAEDPEAELFGGPVLFYNELVVEHFTKPRNVGEMDNADGFAQVGDPSCGDQMKLWIKVESGRIADIKFSSTGCESAIATSSMATVLALGKTLNEAKQLTDDDVILALGGIPEHHRYCSLSGIKAIHAAIADYEQKQKQKAV